MVFKGSKEQSRLVVTSSCWWVLLDEVYNTKLSAHFGAKKMHALLSTRVWRPHMTVLHKDHRFQQHQMGEEVLLSLKTFHRAGTRELWARFIGLFRVFKCVGKIAYRLDLRGRFKDVHNVFHVSQLRKHTPGGSYAHPPKPIQVKGKEQFEVEALLQHRSRGNSRQYLVRWSDYGPEYDEWVYEEELADRAQELLKQYQTAHGFF